MGGDGTDGTPVCYNGSLTQQGDPRMPAVTTPPANALEDPALYLNRELSWLEFNRRV